MTKAVKPIPEGYHTLTAHLVIKGAEKAIDFYKQAFGAEELFRMKSPDGRIAHAELKIGDSIFFLSDEFPEMGRGALSPQSLGGTCFGLNLYVPDVDASYERALKAGASVVMPVADMFWGDRYGQVTDPFGHRWSVATHKEDLTPQEIDERAREFYAQMAQKKTA
jgi:uncharacterized glyoxalase superfamily protein PhnB